MACMRRLYYRIPCVINFTDLLTRQERSLIKKLPVKQVGMIMFTPLFIGNKVYHSYENRPAPAVAFLPVVFMYFCDSPNNKYGS